MYYVSTKGGREGVSQMLTFAYGGGEGGGLRGHAYVTIVWKKMLKNLHKFFQGKRKSLESFYLLYGMINRVILESYCTAVYN